MSPVGRTPRQPASQPSAAVVEEMVRKILNEMGSANLRDKALGYGSLTDGALLGKQNAVVAKVRLSGAGEYEVKHALGAKPVLCELKHIESAVGATPVPHATCSPVRMSEWTETTARVNLFLVAGSLDNVIATFVVKGQ